MRRIYESEALHRDDSDGFSPNERSDTKLQAMRWVNATAVSRRILPYWLRDRAISMSVSVPKTEFALGERIPFRITMANSMPFPITFRTRSPIPWVWHVDGMDDAARISVRDPPEERGEFRFDRGERKRFTKQWSQMIRVSKSEWEPVEPGEYTIGARLNVENHSRRKLEAETTIEVVPR
ncbi:MAG: hypothetical protein IH933_02680 [Euryarchaeota archaeon]|nr:hypothetical protein [Euryarchaeota archaeon]